jgi:predicted Rossmann fold flavoprotein
MNQHFDLIVVGGGAAGFFAALAAKESHSSKRVLLLEKTGSLLTKVRVSGGGRCNVTHACFDPMQLVQNYPRGHKALIGPFTRFQPHDTIQWFQKRGVELKTEADGRMFPVSDDSQTIIECLLREAQKLHVEIRTKQRFDSIQKIENHFTIELSSNEKLTCDRLLLATGSSPQGHQLAKAFGHTIQEPVPSLFTFNIPTSPLLDLSGIALDKVRISLVDTDFTQEGPLLLTHWGFSGPAALKLSAWAARFLHEKKYQVKLSIQWIPYLSKTEVSNTLRALRKDFPSQNLGTRNPFELPKNLWKRLVELSGIDLKKRLSEISHESLAHLTECLMEDHYLVEGKTTHKEEFVTCGGVTLNEIHFKNLESRLCPGLFFAGEILDIDAITGGFNFQNAWTTGWLVGRAQSQILP